MDDLMISINTVEKVKSFVAKIATVSCDVDIMVGRYVIDAKSILGIFSVDISKPLQLRIHATTETEYKDAYWKIQEFVLGVPVTTKDGRLLNILR